MIRTKNVYIYLFSYNSSLQTVATYKTSHEGDPVVYTFMILQEPVKLYNTQDLSAIFKVISSVGHISLEFMT